MLYATIMLMVVILLVVGLCLGSFVNALVWRLYEQTKPSKKRTKAQQEALSITKGRSMCPNCKHTLDWNDLIPVLSWVSLGGKCRYCHKPISWQYPLVELLTAASFVTSYIYWPYSLQGTETVVFGLWLVILTGLVAELVYDLKWMILPDKITFPLYYIGLAMAVFRVIGSDEPLRAAVTTSLAVLVGGGLFYLIFQLSQGKWIGGGDVKLGFLIGLVLADPLMAFLYIFIAAVLGSLVSVALLVSGRLKPSSAIPFGPFLIVGAFITLLFGQDIWQWYRDLLLI